MKRVIELTRDVRRIFVGLTLLTLAGLAPLHAQSPIVRLSFIPHAAYGADDLFRPIDSHRQNGLALGLLTELEFGWPIALTLGYDLWGIDFGCYESPCDSSPHSLHIGTTVRLPLSPVQGVSVLVAAGMGRVFGGRGLHDRLAFRIGAGADIPVSPHVGLRTEVRYQGFRHRNTAQLVDPERETNVVWENFTMLEVGLRITP